MENTLKDSSKLMVDLGTSELIKAHGVLTNLIQPMGLKRTNQIIEWNQK